MWELIVLGLIITLEPLPVIAFILLLASDGGARKGLAYIVGWEVCLVAIVVATLAATGGHAPAPTSAPARGLSAATLLLGLLLLAIAARAHRRAAHPPPPKPPAKWMTRVDTMSLWAAASLGVLLQPWPLVAAGAAQIAQADLSSAASVAAIVAFCVLATASLATMEIYAVVSPEDATRRLDALHRWIDGHRARAIELLALVAGLVLVGKGLYGLT
jgi:hypothetical protein